MKYKKIIYQMLSAWKEDDWDGVLSFVTEDFTFTSPNDDDHIDLTTYK